MSKASKLLIRELPEGRSRRADLAHAAVSGEAVSAVTTVTRYDLADVTPESARYCRDLFNYVSNRGMFTPYGLSFTLVLPGTLGGATWSGGSFDPRSGLFYVNSNELGALGVMTPEPEGAPERYRRTSPHGEYARFWDPHGWPCQKPPWGKLTAIDLNTGTIRWQHTLGNVPEPAGNGLPKTGTPNIGGSIVTAGGLVFIASTTDRRFRAFNARTGQELWSAELPASGHALTTGGRKQQQSFLNVGGQIAEVQDLAHARSADAPQPG